jgi:hypothetical protein
VKTLTARAGVQALTLERLAGTDGQGVPSYGSALALDGFPVREHTVVRTASGDEIAAVATVWVDAGEAPNLPDEQDRLTLADGFVGIVIKREDGRALGSGALDHVVVALREE